MKESRIKKIPAKKGFTFKTAEIRDAKMQDYVNAEILAGTGRGWSFSVALMAITATFDGKPALYEDLLTMGDNDFLELTGASTDQKAAELKKLLFSFNEKDDSADKTSKE